MEREVEAHLDGYAGVCKRCTGAIYGRYVAITRTGGDKPSDYYHVECRTAGPCFGPIDNEPDVTFTEQELRIASRHRVKRINNDPGDAAGIYRLIHGDSLTSTDPPGYVA